MGERAWSWWRITFTKLIHALSRASYLEDLLETGILRLVLEALLPPLRDCGAVEDNHVEVRIEHENDVGLNRRDVEQDGRERSVQRVRHQRRLNCK